MVTYIYTSKDSKVSVTCSFAMGEQPGRVRRAGKWCYRDLAAEVPGGHRSSCWPQRSWACGVHPDQRKEAMKYCAEQGVPVEFDRRGDAVLTSQKHRARVHKALGLYDRNAGYGDRAPQNC